MSGPKEPIGGPGAGASGPGASGSGASGAGAGAGGPGAGGPGAGGPPPGVSGEGPAFGDSGTPGRKLAWDERIDLFVDGMLEGEERTKLETRLEYDAELGQVLADTRDLKRIVSGSKRLAPRIEDLERVLAALRAAPPAEATGPRPGGDVDWRVKPRRASRPLLRFAAAAAVLAAFVGLLSVSLAPAGASLVYAPGIFVRYAYRPPRSTAWAAPWPIPGVDRTPPAADLSGVLGADGVDLAPAARQRLLETGVLWRPAPRPPAGDRTAAPPLATVDQAVALLGSALSSAGVDLEREAVGPDLSRLLDELHAGLVRDRGRARSGAQEAYVVAIDIVETGRALLREGGVPVGPRASPRGGTGEVGAESAPGGGSGATSGGAQGPGSGASRLPAPPPNEGPVPPVAEPVQEDPRPGGAITPPGPKPHGAGPAGATHSASGATPAASPSGAISPSGAASPKAAAAPPDTASPSAARVAAEVALVHAASGVASSPITGAPEDYSAYRGVTRSGPALAVAWLSRPRLPLDRPRDAAAALAIVHALCADSPSGAEERPILVYERIRARHAFFHGAPVDWPPERLVPLLRSRTGERLLLSEVVPDGPLATTLAWLGAPAIEGPLGARPAFSLLGWRWEAASLASARLTGPDRLLGSGLDLLAARGFPGARGMLERLSGGRAGKDPSTPGPAGPSLRTGLGARLAEVGRELDQGSGEADLGRLMELVRREIGRAAGRRGAGAGAGVDGAPDPRGEAARAVRGERAIGQALASLDLVFLGDVAAPWERVGAAGEQGAGNREQGAGAGTGTPPRSRDTRALPVAIEPVPEAFARLAATARAVGLALAGGDPFPARGRHVVTLTEIADLLERVAEGDAEAGRRLSQGAALEHVAGLSLERGPGKGSVRTIDVVLGAEGRVTLQQRVTLGPVETLALVPRPDAPGGWMLARGAGLAAFELAAERPIDPAGREARGDLLPVPPWLRGWRSP